MPRTPLLVPACAGAAQGGKSSQRIINQQSKEVR
jgi:hypothetical protein